jgi:hypothetical protein
MAVTCQKCNPPRAFNSHATALRHAIAMHQNPSAVRVTSDPVRPTPAPDAGPVGAQARSEVVTPDAIILDDEHPECPKAIIVDGKVLYRSDDEGSGGAP